MRGWVSLEYETPANIIVLFYFIPYCIPDKSSLSVKCILCPAGAPLVGEALDIQLLH